MLKSLLDFLSEVSFLFGIKPAPSEIGSYPGFDNEAVPLFLDSLKKSSLYLEYGSGASTVKAALLNKRFVTVESDRSFLDKVISTIGNPPDGSIYLHADIGKTGRWGAPLFKFKTHNRLKKWRNYAEKPWTILGKSLVPDLVLIDGRFRISCALTCFKHLQNHQNACILIDDYVNRPEYKIIEKFGTLTQTAGRMALFKPKTVPLEDLHSAIDIYSADWR